ncbi:MAG: ABC transporter substrate-binding protein [Proteobacteria bacterium]|nr:MAG: ABC transporter substrate-binding protein [Pseudomonadota bacterium]
MRRRDFITLLGGAAAWPLAARAEPERMPRVSVLLSRAESTTEARGLTVLRGELRRLGWEEGRNIRIDHRSASDATRMQQFATELVALRPDVIIAQNTATTASMLQQTRAIPIVFVAVTDPIGSGFIASLPRPGGNVTGFIDLEGSLGSKWLQLLKDIAPRVGRAAFLFNPAMAPYAEYYLGPFKAAAVSLSVEATAAPVRDASEIESIIAIQARAPDAGLVIMPDAFTNVHRAEITSLALRYRLPAVYPYRSDAQLGGLLSYGNDPLDNYRLAATYADKILRGVKPSELPVQTPVKFELVINLKTAKALGLNVPATLIASADEIIE